MSGTQGEYFDKPIRCTENTKHAMATQSAECETVQKVQRERSDRLTTAGDGWEQLPCLQDHQLAPF